MSPMQATKRISPKTTTIIDDGDFRYPVSTRALSKWEAEYGDLDTDNYEQFCADVDHLMPGVMPGSPEMIEECDSLLENGASFRRA